MTSPVEAPARVHPRRPWLTYCRAAEYIDFSLATLYKMVNKGVGPPSVGMGRGRRFNPDDLDAWLANRKPPAEEVAQ